MSKINVNQVDTQCGSTLTLGSSGKTVTLASGASQSGFGRTGTVDWCTTAKTSPFTAVSGDGFFVNTTSGGITVTLPSSPSAGDIVAFKDYANTWDTNNVTLCRNGSKINGVCSNSVLNTESQSVTLIYVDGTKGWQDIHDSTSDVTGQTFISATGGTITTSGNFKIHTFNSDATFTVSSISNQAPFNDVSYVVVAGGGAGGGAACNGCAGAAGGGAGGYRENKGTEDSYTASPLNGGTPITVTATSYPITVGGGSGTLPLHGRGGSGSNSVFSTITSAGGGGGGGGELSNGSGSNGGSGGGGAYAQTAGSGNTPPVSPPQGNGGVTYPSSGPVYFSGGGGGATAAAVVCSPNNRSAGGAGATSSINATPTARAGGGGGAGGGGEGNPGPGGAGGGGAGAAHTPGADGVSGTANTGGGGGGGPAADGFKGGAGGSGIVILRYRYQ